MSDPLSVLQNSFYIGNNFNAILYGARTRLLPAFPDVR